MLYWLLIEALISSYKPFMRDTYLKTVISIHKDAPIGYELWIFLSSYYCVNHVSWEIIDKYMAYKVEICAVQLFDLIMQKVNSVEI